MTHRSSRLLTAWLGLIAMCLVALAPTVSHLLRSSRLIAMPVCTVDGAGQEQRLVLPGGQMMAGMPGMHHSTSTSLTPMSIAPSVLGVQGVLSAMQSRDAGNAAGGGHHTGSQPMDDCGYCDLLNHAPAMPVVAPAAPSLILLLFGALVLPALTRFTPFGAFPSGRPRGPPRVS
jgi:hypothetical protein